MLALKKTVRREKTRLTSPEFQAAATSKAIQAEPPCLLFSQEEPERRVCSQGHQLCGSLYER